MSGTKQPVQIRPIVRELLNGRETESILSAVKRFKLNGDENTVLRLAARRLARSGASEDLVDAADIKYRLGRKAEAAGLYEKSGLLTSAAKCYVESGELAAAEKIASALAAQKRYSESILIYEMLGKDSEAAEVRELRTKEVLSRLPKMKMPEWDQQPKLLRFGDIF
ncbi:Uncharacterised protein [uncultured archaeon]|nr:Uncharacterised protein [uncultured archaeon]